MKHKSILFIIDSLGIGGAQTVVLTLAEQFTVQSYTVHIISCIDKIHYTIPPNISVMTLDYKTSFLAYSTYSKKLHAEIRAIEERNYQQFDLILVNLRRSTRLIRGFSHPNIHYIIHTTPSEGSLKRGSALQRYLKRKKLQRIYNNLNLISVSNGVKNDILENIQIKPQTIQTIYNPINQAKVIELSKEKNPFQGTQYIVHVGRFHHEKRHDLLLKAYKQSNIDAKLILVGDGKERDNITKMIDSLELENKVILTGFIQNPYPVINDAVFLVLCSDYEGLPCVLVEALMLHTPAVSTNCRSGPNEILTNGLQTFLVEPNNIDALASKMNLLYQTASKIEIHEKHTGRFSIKHIAKAYENLISN